MTSSRISTTALLAAALLSPLGCGAVTDEDGLATGVAAEALTGPTNVANMSAAGLVESTGNLYWTQNSFSQDTFRWTGRVYRAAKTSSPGQEAAIYTEGGTWGSSFGNITFANLNGIWYGYFLATYRAGGTYIKRVPLDGSTGAVILGGTTSPASASSPLLSDGTYLYFYGAQGMYMQTLDGSAPVLKNAVSGITAFGYDNSYIYFSAGNSVYKSWKPNPYYTYNIATTTSPVTALAVAPDANGNAAYVYYAAGGNISQYSIAKGYSQSFAFAGSAGLANPSTVSSMSYDGKNLDWIWTDNTNSNQWVTWKLSADISLGNGTLTFVGNAGARQVQGDATRIFYTDNSAVKRFAY